MGYVMGAKQGKTGQLPSCAPEGKTGQNPRRVAPFAPAHGHPMVTDPIVETALRARGPMISAWNGRSSLRYTPAAMRSVCDQTAPVAVDTVHSQRVTRGASLIGYRLPVEFLPRHSCKPLPENVGRGVGRGVGVPIFGRPIDFSGPAAKIPAILGHVLHFSQ